MSRAGNWPDGLRWIVRLRLGLVAWLLSGQGVNLLHGPAPVDTASVDVNYLSGY
jgi:hypothetical protein